VNYLGSKATIADWVAKNVMAVVGGQRNYLVSEQSAPEDWQVLAKLV
jgi:hypothetical protein